MPVWVIDGSLRCQRRLDGFDFRDRLQVYPYRTYNEDFLYETKYGWTHHQYEEGASMNEAVWSNITKSIVPAYEEFVRSRLFAQLMARNIAANWFRSSHE